MHTKINMRLSLRCGHSSIKNVANVWIPPQPEEIAKFTSIKKKRNDHKGGTSMYAIADGYDTKDKIIPSLTTWKL